MDVGLFDYSLPKDRIAQYPLDKRDNSRMMVLSLKKQSISHYMFRDFPDFLNKGDILVLNRTKVIKARLFGRKADTGGEVEVLLLREIETNKWECLVKPGSRLHVGSRIEFNDGVSCDITNKTSYGGRIAKFNAKGNLFDVLNEIGHMPLPPYIKRPAEKNLDEERYQTVYADTDGSVAAPTAGLHFTNEILGILESKGVLIAPLILHVGIGTFQPVKVGNIKEHKMHAELYSVPMETARIINSASCKEDRVFVTGTTAVRALETCASDEGIVAAGSGETSLFIYPGYRFKVLKNLLTNFHLPCSTLLMMVSAFAGREFILEAYAEAIKARYRFYSYGDCMLILD